MAFPISDEFSERRGRWLVPSPWDDTIAEEVATPSAASFLSTQEHVDLRSFRPVTDFRPVPQYPDLDVPPQSQLESVFQSQLEVKSSSTFTENWVTDLNGGLSQNVRGVWDPTVAYVLNDIVEYQGRYYKATGSTTGQAPTGPGAPWGSTFFVGPIAARGGWGGMQVTTTGAALNATLRSSIPNDRVDISNQDVLSILFPDYNTFTSASSYVQLTSSDDGSFGTGHDSAQVAFSASITGMPYLQLNVSAFAQSGFDNKRVSGIRIHLAGTPIASQTITIMAIRAVKSAWVESALDFDTRWGIIAPPVTTSGSIYGGTVAKAFEFVRGNGTPDDPYPADGTYTVFFYPGGGTSPNDATGTNYNNVGLVLRETKDGPGQNGSAILVNLKWKDNELRFEAKRRDTAAGVTTTTTPYVEVINNAGLDPTKQYAWVVSLTGKTLNSYLATVDKSRTITARAWTLAPQSSNDWTFRNGRVGFVADLRSRDSYVDALITAPTGYATLRSRQYESRTPVDGLRLQAVYAPDENLFISLTGADAFRDQTKTTSGAGSIRTLAGVATNQFVVDDWYETYLKADVWVPANVTPGNQPKVVLREGGGVEHALPLPTLQPAQWNSLSFDLRLFNNLITGLPYSVAFEPQTNPDVPLGFFWVDSVVIGRRKVAWSARAQDGGIFRRFYGLVNRPDGALHFVTNERGTLLQVQAEALTPDAWVSEFTVFPHYAELGLPLYDKAFETR
jgi:hypothetical protein